jgi:hypothetical protein
MQEIKQKNIEGKVEEAQAINEETKTTKVQQYHHIHYHVSKIKTCQQWTYVLP